MIIIMNSFGDRIMLKPFDEVFEDRTKLGTKIKTDKYKDSGAHIIIDQGQEQIAGYTDLEDGLFCDVPAIIFGDHTRIIKYVDEPFFLGADGVKVLRCKLGNANYKYLYYVLKHARIPNTGYNRHFKWLKETQISYPDLAMQTRIVDVLERVEAIIEKQKREISFLDDLIKARFVEMFGAFPPNPYGWKTGTIRDVVTDVRYGSSRPATEGGQYPYLRMNNITYGGELDLTDTKRIDVPDNELEKCTVRRGDVLFNRTNSKELVGKACVYDRDEPMVLAGFVIRVRLNELMVPEFLSAFLNTDFSKKMLLGMCKAAIGQANINAQEMQSIGIYIPPIELQREFVSFRNQINKSKSVIQKSLAETQTLFDSLMQQYFG